MLSSTRLLWHTGVVPGKIKVGKGKVGTTTLGAHLLSWLLGSSGQEVSTAQTHRIKGGAEGAVWDFITLLRTRHNLTLTNCSLLEHFPFSVFGSELSWSN